MNVKALLNNTLHQLALGLLTFVMSMGLLILFLNKVDANNPAFFLSANGCGSATTQVTGNVGESRTLSICVDGSNEGRGFYGAEIGVSYDSSLLSVTSVSCRNFDRCSNLSGTGSIRLLGASSPEGNAVTGRETFGSVSFNLKKAGTTTLSFSTARIIDENQQVQSRIGISTKVTALEPAPSPEPKPEPSTSNTTTSVPESTTETTTTSTTQAVPAPNYASLSKVVISPLSRTGTPGQVIQVISRADYNNGRASENITSCFDCPTAGNKSAEGRIKYSVTGPATVYGNRVTIKKSAKAGQVIRVTATYTDHKSNTTATSGIRTITVAAAASCDPATGEGCDTPRPDNTDLTTPDGSGTGCDPATGAGCDVPNEIGGGGGSGGGCFDAAGNPIDCVPPPSNGCDPAVQDCGGTEPTCDPAVQDCGGDGGEGECDPKTQDCGAEEQPQCDPNTENCGDGGQGGCDPNTQDCGDQQEPCQNGDCGKKEEPNCDNYNCEPGKEEHELICHVLDPEKSKYIGALIYLPKKEAEKHLKDDEFDYLVSDLDNNPNNDSEDCLGIDICKYKKLHGSANETDQCNTEEVLKLTEMSLFHPAADECVTCALFVPAEPTNEYCAAQYDTSTDSDNDGLSDRTECYLNTNVNDVDSDNDSCWDGDEVNLFYTNPLVQTDCVLSEMAYEKVVITDPKNDWTVSSLNISGITPKTTLDVGITAFPASHKTLTPITETFDKLLNDLQQVIDPSDVVAREKRNSDLATLTKELKSKIQAFYAFTKEQSDVNYEKEIAILKTVEKYLEKSPSEMLESYSEAEALKRSLQTIETGGIFLGLINQFKEVALGDQVVSGFNLIPRVPVEDGLYDLVAVARLQNKTLTSEPVRINLDSSAQTNAPRPEALDGIKLDSNHVKQGWELTSENMLSNVQVKTKNGRPVLSGQSSYGAQIFATWESLTLSSSVIVDSSEGTFEIQAPRELEKNADHKVTLYAVADADKGKVRSDNVTVNFHVEGGSFLPWIIGGLAMVLIAGAVAARRMRKIDAEAPEHRAKENELYHAFGEKERPAPEPEGHHDRAEEVQNVFGRQA